MMASARLTLSPPAPVVAPWPRCSLPARVPTTSDPEAPNVQSLARALLLLCCLSLILIASPARTVAQPRGLRVLLDTLQQAMGRPLAADRGVDLAILNDILTPHV